MNVVSDITIIAVVAACSFATRVAPFLIFGRSQKPSENISYIGNILPSAVIAILIVYCLKGVSFGSMAGFLPSFLSVVVVAALHVWKRNNLLSIGVGTACYMVLVQFVFL